MSDINRVNGFLRAIPVDYLSPRASERFRSATGTTHVNLPVDDVEVSDLGSVLARLAETPGVRVGKIARIRAEIAAGAYESPEKIDATVDRLLGELAR
jgi:hypothetical protein